MLLLTQSNRLKWMVIVGAVAVLSGLVAGVTWPVRGALREQVLQREATAIDAVARLQRDLGTANYRELGIEPNAVEVFDALLESAQLEGVVALQLYNAEGVGERELPLLAYVKQLGVGKRVREPKAILYEQGAKVRGAGDALTGVVGPWLEVIVPLYQDGQEAPHSWARYWIDGRQVVTEWAAIDRQLWIVAGWSGGLGAITLILVLGWAFARLQRQAEDLARANRELLLHTKTAAIGAISSHLIHGLKNPLAGLEGFMAEDPDGNHDGERSGEAWREAAETTRRVRRMINEVLEVLRETTDAADYEVPVNEVVAAAGKRVSDLAKAADVTLRISGGRDEVELPGNTAALSGLVLHNLLENAVAATPAGGEVDLTVVAVRADRVCLEICDTGSGLPDAVRQANFAPVVSSKLGGAGLGLALSHQLARHAGGQLKVVKTGRDGTNFSLEVPLGVDVKIETEGTLK